MLAVHTGSKPLLQLALPVKDMPLPIGPTWKQLSASPWVFKSGLSGGGEKPRASKQATSGTFLTSRACTWMLVPVSHSKPAASVQGNAAYYLGDFMSVFPTSSTNELANHIATLSLWRSSLAMRTSVPRASSWLSRGAPRPRSKQ